MWKVRTKLSDIECRIQRKTWQTWREIARTLKETNRRRGEIGQQCGTKWAKKSTTVTLESHAILSSLMWSGVWIALYSKCYPLHCPPGILQWTRRRLVGGICLFNHNDSTSECTTATQQGWKISRVWNSLPRGAGLMPNKIFPWKQLAIFILTPASVQSKQLWKRRLCQLGHFLCHKTNGGQTQDFGC